jgi:hypothetical protein
MPSNPLTNTRLPLCRRITKHSECSDLEAVALVRLEKNRLILDNDQQMAQVLGDKRLYLMSEKNSL